MACTQPPYIPLPQVAACVPPLRVNSTRPPLTQYSPTVLDHLHMSHTFGSQPPGVNSTQPPLSKYLPAPYTVSVTQVTSYSPPNSPSFAVTPDTGRQGSRAYLSPPLRTFSSVTGIPNAQEIQQHTITTPVNSVLLEDLLSTHPNRPLVAYLITSLRSGFRIGYTGPRHPLRAPNLSSAFLRPEVIDQALCKEISLGRVAGPFDNPPFTNFRCSGLGLVPKDGNDWRLIFHLSAPAGVSVNDFISPEDFSLHYHTIDDAISLLHRLGPGALMAKADLKSAFRLCPVHPLDWPLLGIQWRNQYFVDKCLLFGLSSSPYLFNLVADALKWCLDRHYGVVDSFHYLDDFFFAGPTASADCSWAINSFQLLCSQLGVPLKPEKLVLPTTKMTFLGIHLDSESQIASIPQDKMDALLAVLRQHIQLYRNGTPVLKRSMLSPS